MLNDRWASSMAMMCDDVRPARRQRRSLIVRPVAFRRRKEEVIAKCVSVHRNTPDGSCLQTQRGGPRCRALLQVYRTFCGRWKTRNSSLVLIARLEISLAPALAHGSLQQGALSQRKKVVASTRFDARETITTREKFVFL